MYDIAVVGGGPAGLTAALYALRAGKKVLIIEKAAFGGQITFSPKVENIPGFTEISGNEFAEKMVDQVLAQGGEFEVSEATAIKDGKTKTVITDSGEFEAKAVVIAAGARHRLLGLENEQNLIGNGISFCAVCDGAFFAGKTVGVVGGGNSALQEALLLAETSRKVMVFQNLDRLTGEQKLIDRLDKKSNVEVLLGCEVLAYTGIDELQGVVVCRDGETREYKLDGLFLAVGLVPQNAPFADVAALDDRGYIAAGEDCVTATPGVFVAGDCRNKQIRQVTTACADGAVAALAACRYIDSL